MGSKNRDGHAPFHEKTLTRSIKTEALKKKRMSPRFKFHMWVVVRNNSAEDHIETEEVVSTTHNVRRLESQSRKGWRNHQQREDISFATVRWQMVCDTTKQEFNAQEFEEDVTIFDATRTHSERERPLRENHETSVVSSFRPSTIALRDWRGDTICVLLLLHPSGSQIVRVLSALSSILEGEDTQRDLFLREDSFVSQWL